MFKSDNGAVLNFFESTGTINVQGKKLAKLELEQQISKALEGMVIEKAKKPLKIAPIEVNSFDDLIEEIGTEDYPSDYVPWKE